MQTNNEVIKAVSSALQQRLTLLKLQVNKDLAQCRDSGHHQTGGVDRGDDAHFEQDAHMIINSAYRDADELEQIESALYRLESGNFGLCEQCDQPIPDQRLIAHPTSRFCVVCQDKRESDQDERDSTPSI